MKQKGFTLIEVMIVIAIIAILFAVALPAIFGTKQTTNVSFGINGAIEERCISGYMFIIGHDGRSTQVLNEFGKGVPCPEFR